MSVKKKLKEYDRPPAHYREVPIQAAPVRTAIKIMLRELLKEAYEPNPESIKDPEKRKYAEDLNRRIRQAWVKETGSVFIYTTPVVPFLHGEPGHGKTTACLLAAKEFARLVGMNFVHLPDNDYKPELNDFLYIQMETAGEVSSAVLGGLMAKGADENGEEFMHKVPMRQLQMARSAGFSFLVYDDMKNAIQNIQNVIMALMEERALQGTRLGRVSVAGTGNLGTDGTHVYQMSSAAMTRMMNLAAYDTVGDFIDRVLTGAQNPAPKELKTDVAGDAVVSFLLMNPDMFTEKPEREKVNGSYANPRTWSKLIEKLRSDLHELLSRESMIAVDLNESQSQGLQALIEYANELGIDAPTTDELRVAQQHVKEKHASELESTSLMERVNLTVGGIIGVKKGKAGEKFASYLYRRLSYGTDLMANSIMNTGALTSEQNRKFVESYSGRSIDAKDFGHHMVVSMAEAASGPLASAMRDNDHEQVKLVAQRFAKGMFAPADMKIDGQKFNVALDNGEINRGLYFLVSKTAGMLNDHKKLRPSPNGYTMEASFLQSFITGVAKEPAAAQVVDGGTKKRFDLMTDMLTNQKESDAIVSDELAKILEQSRNEKAVTAQEAKELEDAHQQSRQQPAPKATESQEQPDKKPEHREEEQHEMELESDSFEPNPSPAVTKQSAGTAEASSQPEPTRETSQKASMDPFEMDDADGLDPFDDNTSAPVAAKEESLPKDEDLPVNKEPEDEFGFEDDFDVDDDLDFGHSRAGGMGR